MMTCQKISIQALNSTLKCTICRADIKDNTAVYQSRTNYGIICGSCYQKFSEEDIELMLILFVTYGGYFGKLPRDQFSFFKALKEIQNKTSMIDNPPQIIEINMRLLHRSLLHGLYPEQYQAQLRKLINSSGSSYFL
jgi:hypothetical protein